MQSVSADPLSGRACGNTPRFLFRNSNLKIQTDSQTDRQTDNQPDRHTDRLENILSIIFFGWGFGGREPKSTLKHGEGWRRLARDGEGPLRLESDDLGLENRPPWPPWPLRSHLSSKSRFPVLELQVQISLFRLSTSAERSQGVGGKGGSL